MANTVTIDVEARFRDNTSAGARSAAAGVKSLGDAADKSKAKVEGLGKAKAKPLFDADDGKLIKKLREAENKAQKLGRTKTTVVLGAMDKATTAIGKALNKAQAFAGKTYSAILKIKDSDALARINKIVAGAKNIAGKTWNAAVKIKDLATAPLQKIKNSLFSIKTLITAITAGIAAKKLVFDPVGLADAYSSAQIGFSTLLGDAGGQAMMDQIDAFAKATPFKTSGVITNVQKMMAYGWDADSIIKDMETIGDAAAATGKGDAGLESIVYALSEIRSKGKLSAQELNQLASAGIKARQYLAEGLGYGSSDEGLAKLSADLDAGAIGANQAIELIMQGMKEFDGMMDRTANETVSGLKAQLEDTFEINVLRRWGQGLQDGAKRGLGAIVSMLGDADNALIGFGDTVYEVGKAISGGLADKLSIAVERIKDITDTFEFRNANLGEKISMLWKGVVTDPLKEWWDGGGHAKTAATAGKIGNWIGKSITSGLLAILGVTDILDDSGLEEGGAGIAQSFAKGFVDGFDVSAITGKLVDAIGDVWNALPLWGKALVAGYGVSKLSGAASALGGLASSAGGTLGPAAGKLLGSAAAGTGLLGFGSNMAIGLGTGNMAGGASLGAGALSAIGLGSTAGLLASGAGLVHAFGSFDKAGEAFVEGDTSKGWANTAKGGFTLAGMGAGALAGAKIGAAVGSLGGPAGTLIGAGLGTAIGWFAGDKIARNIEAAKYESAEMQAAIKDANTSSEELARTFQKEVWTNMKNHFGDVTLSMSEIERLADQIVWGDDLESFEKFSTATKNAEANFKSLKASAEETGKWMWKAGLGVKFNDDEREAIVTSFDNYIDSAKAYLENKHYEFTAAVSLLIEPESEAGQKIIGDGNVFYQRLQDELEELGAELSGTLSIALEDGVITLDESAEIASLQQQMADIINAVANAETSAELDLIKLKFGDIDIESFQSLMSQMQTTIDERVSTADEAFVLSVSSLKMQFEAGEIDRASYEQSYQALAEGYAASLGELKTMTIDTTLDIIVNSSYGDELGENAREKLQTALETSLSQGIDPIEWTPDQARQFLGVDTLSEEAAAALGELLGGVAGLIKPLEIDGTIDKLLPDSVEKTVGVDITGEKEIQNSIEILSEDFDIPTEQAAVISLLLTGDEETLNTVDVSALAEEFNVPESVAENVIVRLTAEKSVANRLEIIGEDFGIPTEQEQAITWALTGKKLILNKLSISASDFGIPSTINKTVSVNVASAINQIGPVARGKYRGGIVGGGSSAEAYARGGIAGFSEGGMVHGGARLIKVAEEGSPEMIIPLSSQRRERGLKLWEKAGNMLGVPGFAKGGIVGGEETPVYRPENYEIQGTRSESTVSVSIGGVTIQIDANGSGGDIISAVRAQKEQIAEEVAGVFAQALKEQFANTPTRGGGAA